MKCDSPPGNRGGGGGGGGGLTIPCTTAPSSEGRLTRSTGCLFNFRPRASSVRAVRVVGGRRFYMASKGQVLYLSSDFFQVFAGRENKKSIFEEEIFLDIKLIFKLIRY